jgi:hypothetical protein
MRYGTHIVLCVPTRGPGKGSDHQARWWCADACTSPWSSPANGPTHRLGGTRGVAVSSASLHPAAAAAPPETTTTAPIASPSLHQPIDVGSYGDASLWCARPKDAYGISTHTFKSDWYVPYTSGPSSPSSSPRSSYLVHDPIQGSLLPSVVPAVRPQEPDETVPDQPGRCRNQQRAARCERVTTPDLSARPDLVCSIRAEGHLDVPHGPLPATTRERRGLHFDVGRRPGPHLGLRTSLPFHTTHDRPWA